MNLESSQLYVEDSTFQGDETNGIRAHTAILTLIDSTLESNGRNGLYVALSFVGGLSEIVIDGSTIASNARNGIEFETVGPGDGSDLVIVNSTLSGNNLNLDLGRETNVDISFSTLANALSGFSFEGGRDSTVVVSDSVVEGGCLLYPDNLSFALINGSVWDDDSCGPSSGTVVDLGLLPLADNGGRTQTHALLWDSPAIDSAALRCLAPEVGGVDQRGMPRPEGVFCDAGAVEVPEPGFWLGLAAGAVALSRQVRRQKTSSAQGSSVSDTAR